MLKTIIIENEKDALNSLEALLPVACPQINLFRVSQTIEQAQEYISEESPDLIFINQMITRFLENQVNIFNQSNTFETIFLSHFVPCDWKTLEIYPIGFLLKPLQKPALIEAVKLAEKRIAEKAETKRIKQVFFNLINPESMNPKIGIPTMQGLEFVKTNRVVRCEGLQRCTKVVIENGRNIISSYNLGEFKRLLHNFGFYMPHKSHLINLYHIERYEREGMLQMTDGTYVPVSRRKRQEFVEQVMRV